MEGYGGIANVKGLVTAGALCWIYLCRKSLCFCVWVVGEGVVVGVCISKQYVLHTHDPVGLLCFTVMGGWWLPKCTLHWPSERGRAQWCMCVACIRETLQSVLCQIGNCECVYTSCQVNPRFAINLVAEEPVVIIDGNHTYCDGGQLHVLC